MARPRPPCVLGLAAASIATLCLASVAAAEDLSRAAFSVGGGPVTTLDTSKARDIPYFVDTQTFFSIEPGYDATQAVAAAIDIRGLRGSVTCDAFSNTLRFVVPEADVDISFDGPSSEVHWGWISVSSRPFSRNRSQWVNHLTCHLSELQADRT